MGVDEMRTPGGVREIEGITQQLGDQKSAVISARADDPNSQPRTGWSRRSFLRLVGAGAVGTAFAFFGALPPARRAEATHLTPKPYAPGYVCYTPLYGGTGCCDCGSLVSSAHCGSDNWARHHDTASYDYELRPTSCGGSWNAWKWQRSDTGHWWRCSDGKRRPLGCGCSYTKTVCPYDLGIT